MRLRYRNAIEHGLCVAALSLAPLLLLLPGAIQGHVAIDTATLLSLTPWEEARPAGYSAESDAQGTLATLRYLPWYRFISEVGSVRETLWNPLEYGGQPFLAAWRTRCLSPFTLPFFLGDTFTALAVSIYLKIMLAGIFAFYAARRFGLTPALSLIPAVSFQFCGPLIVWSSFPISDVLPWLPLLILFCERLALGDFRTWPGGVVVLTAMLLGGEPEAFVVLFAVALCYLLLRTAQEWQGPAPGALTLTAFIVASLLAIGATCIQWLLYTEFARFAVESADVPARVVPSPSGLSGWLIPYSKLASNAATAFHVGIALVLLLPAWLALRSFAEKQTRNRCESILVLLVVNNLAGYFWLPIAKALPALISLNPEHFFLFNAFGLGMVGAFTADEWNRLGVDEIVRTVKRFLVLCPLTLGLLVLPTAWPGLHEGMFAGPWWAMAIAATLVVLVLASLAATVLHPSARRAGYAFTIIIVADLVFTFSPSIPATPRALVFPETPFVSMLAKTGNRVSGSSALGQWPLAGNGIPQLFGTGGILLKHQQDFAAHAATDPMIFRRSGTPLLLLRQEDIQGPFAPIREILKIEQVFPTGAVLFYDTEAKSRAWMAYEVRNVEHYDPAQLDSAKPVLVEQGVPPPPLPDDKDPGAVTVEPSTSNTKVTVKLSGVSQGILVLADAYFPGWEARIDGEPARVFPADVLFRGVEVPEGAKEVVFEYNPSHFSVGMLISGASVLVLLAGMLFLLPSTIRAAMERKPWTV